MEEIKEITQIANVEAIAHQIERLLSGKLERLPEFPQKGVPVSVAAKVYGKDPDYIKSGIIAGWLPIGRATRDGQLVTDIKQMDSRLGRINYYISPRKLWEDTGYVWRGDEKT